MPGTYSVFAAIMGKRRSQKSVRAFAGRPRATNCDGSALEAHDRRITTVANFERKAKLEMNTRSAVQIRAFIHVVVFLLGAPSFSWSDEVDSRVQVQEVEELLAEHPDDVESMVVAGNLYYDLKDWERAKYWYMRSLDYNPANPGVLTDLGVVHRNLDQYEAAVLSFNAALAVAPDHWQALYNKALVFGLDYGRTDDALALLDAIEALKTEHADIPDLASIRAKLGSEARPKGPQQKQQDVFRLIELSGGAELAEMVLDNFLEMGKQAFPDVPDRFWAEFAQSVDAQVFVDLAAPIWDKYFTHQDILDMIEFYETPIGQKLVRLQPTITQEMMEAGQRWGEELGQEIAEKLSAAGYLPPAES